MAYALKEIMLKRKVAEELSKGLTRVCETKETA